MALLFLLLFATAVSPLTSTKRSPTLQAPSVFRLQPSAIARALEYAGMQKSFATGSLSSRSPLRDMFLGDMKRNYGQLDSAESYERKIVAGYLAAPSQESHRFNVKPPSMVGEINLALLGPTSPRFTSTQTDQLLLLRQLSWGAIKPKDEQRVGEPAPKEAFWNTFASDPAKADDMALSLDFLKSWKERKKQIE